MSDKEIKVGLKITGDADNANSAINTLKSSIGELKNYLIGLFALDKAIDFANDLIAVNREMESLKAQLKSVTQSSESAQQAFEQIQKFAKDTPFSVKDLTETFIQLRTFGIEPTNEVMLAITNQTSKLGASTETLKGVTMALGQAWSKGKLQGEEIMQLVERGIPVWDILQQVTGKNVAELQSLSEKGELGRETIQKLISKIGELTNGSNAEAVNTLNGAFSNLADSWQRFEDNLLGSKAEGVLKRIIDKLSNLIGLVDFSVNEDSSIGDTLYEIEATKTKIKAMQKNDDGSFIGNLSGWVDGVTGQSMDAELSKLQALEKKRDALLDEHKKNYEKSEELRAKDEAAAAKRTALAISQAPDSTAVSGKSGGGGSSGSGGLTFLDNKLHSAAAAYGFNPDAVKAAFERAAQKSGIPVNVIMAQSFQESKFNPNARSPTGAVGISQFLKGTAGDFHLKDRTNPIESIRAQGDYMAMLMKMFHGNVTQALHAYNGGQGTMLKVLAGKANMTDEMRNYPGLIYKWAGKTERVSKDRVQEMDAKDEIDQVESQYKSELEALKQAQAEKLAIAKNSQEAKFAIAENNIELSAKQAEFESRSAISALKRLKDDGKIGTNEYYASLTAAQESAIKANISAIKQKMELADRQLSAGKSSASPADIPRLEASHKIQNDKYLQDIEQLNAAILELYQSNNAALAKENAEAQLKANKAHLQELEEAEKFALARLELEKQAAKDQLDMGEITQEEYLAKLQAFEDKRYAITKKALDDRRSLIGEGKYQSDMDAATSQHGANTRGINKQVDQNNQAKFNTAFAPLNNALDQSVNGILTGQQTIAHAAKNAAQSIALSYAQAFIKTRIMAAAQWAWELAGFAGVEAKKKAIKQSGEAWNIAQTLGKKARLAGEWLWEVLGFGGKEATKTSTKIASEAAQTSATLAATAIRKGADETAASSSLTSILSGSGTKILAKAGEAAASVYASVSSIPFVGWLLAPVAAGAAFAAVTAFNVVGSAKQGEWRVSEDGSPYVLHENESVLPSGVADNFRKVVGMVERQINPPEHPMETVNNLLASGQIARQLTLTAGALSLASGSKTAANTMAKEHASVSKQNNVSNVTGGDTHNHYNGIMLSPEQFFKQNSKAIVGAITKEHRNFNTGKR